MTMMEASIGVNRKPLISPANLKHYPGGTASAKQILRLAEEYRKAAHSLQKLGRRRDPLSWAPCRLSSIHAIELFLNAFLLHAGQEASCVRGMQHDLVARTEVAIKNGLQLRRNTATHIARIVGNREYLLARYDPEVTASISQINRLIATLEEIASKVSTGLNCSR